MLETECFKELNIFGPGGAPTPDLIGNTPPPKNEDSSGCCGLFKSSRSRTRVSTFKS